MKIHKRVIILGLLLIPFNNYWLIELEAKWYAWPTYAVPFSNAVFLLLVFVSLNFVLRKYLPSCAFSQADLLVLYTMLSLASGICCYNLMAKLVPTMGHVFWFATSENEWKELFWRHFPSWLSVKDKGVLKGYYLGESSFYTFQHLRAWLIPILWWSIFAFVLFFVMACINIILRKQWTQRERLTYPITKLPLEMTDFASGFFRNKLMWIGFALAGTLTFINGLSFIFPSVPSLPIKRRNIGQFFTEKPWSAIGWTNVSFYPFLVGLGFLMPLDLSFSCWFFFLMGKVQRIIGSMGGWRSLPGFPYISEQSLGAYIGMCIMFLWLGRRHFKKVLISLVKREERKDDTEEAMYYRTAVIGLIAGAVFLYLFSLKVGMSFWFIPVFFGFYYLISLLVTRMRAELGFPIHGMSDVGPYTMLPNLLGTRTLGASNLAANNLYFWFTMGHASDPMPHQLEGMRYAEKSDASQRKMMIAMLLAVGLGVISCFWVLLEMSYRHGAESSYLSWTTYRYGASYTLRRFKHWLTYPTHPDYPALTFVGIGFIVAIILFFLRMRFLWWPFHPIGYGLASGWGLANIWTCLLVSSIIKWIVLKYGGLKAHRKAVPFFLGIILGDFTIGFSWFLIGMLFNISTYTFWP